MPKYFDVEEMKVRYKGEKIVVVFTRNGTILRKKEDVKDE